jgi:hypothetical protein
MAQIRNPAPLAGGNRAGNRYAGQQSFTLTSLSAQDEQRLRRQQLAQRVHRRGARVLFELVDEIARHNDLDQDIDRRLAAYANLDWDTLQALGGDRFPQNPTRVVRDHR